MTGGAAGNFPREFMQKKTKKTTGSRVSHQTPRPLMRVEGKYIDKGVKVSGRVFPCVCVCVLCFDFSLDMQMKSHTSLSFLSFHFGRIWANKNKLVQKNLKNPASNSKQLQLEIWTNVPTRRKKKKKRIGATETPPNRPTTPQSSEQQLESKLGRSVGGLSLDL